MAKQLRYYQEECLFSIFDYFAHKQGNPICAIPTGLGKSLAIAEFIRRVMITWPDQRIIMSTHVAELVKQNAEALIDQWPVAPLGIHSAELGERQTAMPVIFGNVQSMYRTIKKLEDEDKLKSAQFRAFGWRDLFLCDEAHLISQKETSQYQYVIGKLKEINPNLKVIGFTATPFRTKQGLLHGNGGLFTDVCYDITGVEKFNKLIAEGYMAPLIPRPTESVINVTNIKITAGDFNEKQAEEEANKITYEAIKEAMHLGYYRNYWIVFAAGINNCENITSMLQSFGIEAVSCHSKLSKKENQSRIEAYRNKELRAIVGANKLTTGVNFPHIDLVVDLQPTISPGKHIQKLGRATRISPETGKVNAVVLDFAGNVPRCGPINDPCIPKPKGKKVGTAPVKICPMDKKDKTDKKGCGMYNSASARFCGGGNSKEIALSYGGCGFEFSFETKVFTSAGTNEIIKSNDPVVEMFNVRTAFYALHEKIGSPPSMKVTYVCGLKSFKEWVCLEHKDPVGKRARDWWRLRHSEEPPLTTFEALRRQKELRTPRTITVRLDNDYPEILSAEF